MSKKEITNVLPDVKEQYEELPYPLRNPEDEKKMFFTTAGSSMPKVNHICFNGRQDFNNFRVLVAGGGTGDAAISWAEQLRNKENSEVIYLDMSSKSMSIAQERAKVRQLDNITWINDSLLNVKNIGIGEFDFIDCSGVLHHLEDPDAGLKALKSVLKPDGALYIMVYAKYGRTPIYIIQELMRMINSDTKDNKEKIKNTRTTLESLPSYNIYNIFKGLKIWNYNDTNYDAGIFDLFLHTQDRAYTILEAHEWLERCGMKMLGEPGNKYEQKQYIPETFITNKDLLDKINKLPLKVQQSIGETMSTKISKHSFFCIHSKSNKMEADINCEDMVLDTKVHLKDLAKILLERNDAFTITYEKHPGKPSIEIPNGKYMVSLLNAINGERTIEEIIETVKNSPKWKNKEVNDTLLRNDLETLFTSIKRADLAYLRHKSITKFESATDMQKRVANLYKK